MTDLRAVLFDLDGTLHDRAETVRRYLAGHIERHGFHHHAGYAERFTELDNHGYTGKREVFRQLVDEYRLSHDPEALLQDFSDHAWIDCARTPGTHEVLAALRSRGIKLGLVTNGWSAKQRACLAALELTGAFDAVIVSEEAGVKKPDPRIYQLTLTALDAAAEAAVFVGDHPENDVRGPQALGIRTAFLSGAFTCPPDLRPDVTLSALADLMPALRL
jgi:putative hydrolase of the HAD superfamily